ncbi:hypothetical protein LCGC14_1701860 [marine sediment metagenome]|uniref:Uncharacterized protein n=1 Tax=marine sediment metagenome TaxID=412755 RepID=A0A0F9I5B5_9ZZZZ
MKKRRKTNIKRVIASIRRDIIDKFGIEVPNEDIVITWSGGDKRIIYLHVLERNVTGSVKEQFYGIGKI